MEVIRLRNLYESTKVTVGELRTKIEQLETDNYNLNKSKEKVEYEMTNQVVSFDSGNRDAKAKREIRNFQ